MYEILVVYRSERQNVNCWEKQYRKGIRLLYSPFENKKSEQKNVPKMSVAKLDIDSRPRPTVRLISSVSKSNTPTSPFCNISRSRLHNYTRLGSQTLITCCTLMRMLATSIRRRRRGDPTPEDGRSMICLNQRRGELG